MPMTKSTLYSAYARSTGHDGGHAPSRGAPNSAAQPPTVTMQNKHWMAVTRGAAGMATMASLLTSSSVPLQSE